jgi:hypothetical protein
MYCMNAGWHVPCKWFCAGCVLVVYWLCPAAVLARLPDGSGIRAVHALVVSTPSDRAQQRNDTDVSNYQQPIRHLMYGR